MVRKKASVARWTQEALISLTDQHTKTVYCRELIFWCNICCCCCTKDKIIDWLDSIRFRFRVSIILYQQVNKNLWVIRWGAGSDLIWPLCANSFHAFGSIFNGYLLSFSSNSSQTASNHSVYCWHIRANKWNKSQKFTRHAFIAKT